MHLINGIARIFEYEVLKDEEGNEVWELTALIEGQIKKGMLNGYARVMNFESEICFVGFWTPRVNVIENW